MRQNLLPVFYLCEVISPSFPCPYSPPVLHNTSPQVGSRMDEHPQGRPFRWIVKRLKSPSRHLEEVSSPFPVL